MCADLGRPILYGGVEAINVPTVVYSASAQGEKQLQPERIITVCVDLSVFLA